MNQMHFRPAAVVLASCLLIAEPVLELTGHGRSLLLQIIAICVYTHTHKCMRKIQRENGDILYGYN